jgi:hypothetical protein
MCDEERNMRAEQNKRKEELGKYRRKITHNVSDLGR